MPGEVKIPGVKGPTTLRPHFDEGGSKDMAAIVEDEFEFRPVDVKRTLQRNGFPGRHAVINPAMGVEGVFLLQGFFPLPGHDIHRVVEERFGEGCGGGGHPDLGAGAGAGDQGHGPHVIVMGVGKDHGLQILWQGIQQRGRRPPFHPGMHAGIQQDRSGTRTQ